jgi:hypothetical protein
MRTLLNAALDAERALRAARKRKREQGFLELKKHKIHVDFVPGEFDNETDQQASMCVREQAHMS